MASSSTSTFPVCEWRCALCNATFADPEAAKQHARESHPERGNRLVSVAATTWKRDAKGLFDREDVENHQHQGLVLPFNPTQPPLRFLREDGDLKLVQGPDLPESSPMHTQISWGREGPVIEKTPTATKQSSSRSMWVTVEDAGHVLRKGDHIKLGRYTIGVRQIVLTGPAQIPNFSSVKDVGTAPIGFSTDGERTCRICLDTTETEEDKIISAPCLCRGGMQYIHLGCLRHWLGTRYSVTDRMRPPMDGAAAYSFKPPACDICKTEFPASFPQGEDEEPITLLSNLPLVTPPFIVFTLPKSQDKERPHGERCVFAPGTGAILKIGRSQESGLQLMDVSVSRVHATVVFRGNDFILENNEARFGTSVMPHGPRRVPEDGALSIQAGRTLLRLAMEPMTSMQEERHQSFSL